VRASIQRIEKARVREGRQEATVVMSQKHARNRKHGADFAHPQRRNHGEEQYTAGHQLDPIGKTTGGEEIRATKGIR